ncbi:MAG: glycerate dehydrogenase [Ahrensia sp.]|nr:glycerate dehydrogenase [Ahrensia sp.]|tara:strand:- start:47302 stop:48291 length:990 start_codon:yes stop_codon:yes gene_type:complete
MIRIVFLDRDTLAPETVLRAPSFDAEVEFYGHTSADQVAERLADADIAITNKVPIGEAVLPASQSLRHVAIAATGYDVVDIEACRRHGVSVSNIRAYANDTVPEHTFALILALRRSLVPYRQSVIDGRWEDAGAFCYFDYPIENLAGRRLGIIGDGALGRRVAQIGHAFGMEPVFSSYEGLDERQMQTLFNEDFGSPRYASLEKVLRTSDVITLHCPLMPSTRQMISDEQFAMMEQRPLLINTARGGLVNEAALERALEAGQISGAGFDVVTTEPPGEGHVMHRIALRSNVIVTPHVAWAARDAVQALADQLMDNVEAFHAGKSRNLIS